MERDQVVNAQQAAEFLGAHVETIRRMARKGTIPAFKVGKDWRFHRASLLSWIKTNPQAKVGINILVIEDEEPIRKLIRRHLESYGYRVLTAANGEEGLRLVRSGSVNLVILDLEMPVMNGPTFIGELKKDCLNIPIIIASGYPDSTLMMEASRFGPLTLVPKPIERKMLISAVNMTVTSTTKNESFVFEEMVK